MPCSTILAPWGKRGGKRRARRPPQHMAQKDYCARSASHLEGPDGGPVKVQGCPALHPPGGSRGASCLPLHRLRGVVNHRRFRHNVLRPSCVTASALPGATRRDEKFIDLNVAAGHSHKGALLPVKINEETSGAGSGRGTSGGEYERTGGRGAGAIPSRT